MFQINQRFLLDLICGYFIDGSLNEQIISLGQLNFRLPVANIQEDFISIQLPGIIQLILGKCECIGVRYS